MIDVLHKLRALLSAREQRGAVALLAMMLVGAVMEMAGVAAIPAFIALLSDPAKVQRFPAVRVILAGLHFNSDRTLVLAAAATLLTIFVLKNSYASALLLAQTRYVTRRQMSIATRLVSAYLNAPYTFHLQRNSAELQRNANNEAMDVVGGVLLPGLTLVMESLTATAILALLLFAEPFISLVALLLLGGATALFISVVRKRLHHYGQLAQFYRLKMIQTINEALGSTKVTMVLGRQRHFLHTYRAYVDRFTDASRFRMVMAELPRLYLETIAMFGMLGVAALLVAQQRAIESIIPTLSLLAVAIVRMIPSFNRITAGLTAIRYGRFALDVVHQDLFELASSNQVGSKVSEATEEPLTFEEFIRLADVHFTYPGAGAPSLRGISLSIRRGDAVGFVGPTGSGKTTLIDVVLGLLRPAQGRVLVDGTDIAGREESWQRRIGYVPQDVYLVDDSIRRNIAFGIPDDAIDDSAVRRAIEAAQLMSFVASLPQMAETLVGEQGVRLSGGQRQRIGIARALYHDPDVLVLDEATSSLDNETERYVMEAIEHLRGKRTMLIVAHRMTTVRSCDELFVLRAGRVVASGNYDELIAVSSDFRRLAATH